uniref:Uncharacterized protein n=1 Tax=Ditylenchus dipsaci TaxID=166011 RepID=A0A915CYL6_9BILA
MDRFTARVYGHRRGHGSIVYSPLENVASDFWLAGMGTTSVTLSNRRYSCVWKIYSCRHINLSSLLQCDGERFRV